MYSLIIGIRERAENILFSAFLRKKMKKFSSIETFFNTLPSSWYLPSLLE
ncbi:hypothetical protein BSMD_014290 [Bacillus subtilis Miyagi-4]|nr:hypothetical protein BSNT_09109 [Bacillus subtilis subsp. natto BEST195]GAK79521.1 hypothetical protein BSMD_014290 [Bacillus subtilis Miyagi-4]